MRKNFPYKDEINYAILKLQESGFMHKLKTKWWKQKGAKNCKAMREAASSTAKPLTVENVAGAFLVLVVGMAMATVTATTEFLWSYRSIFNRENVIIVKGPRGRNIYLSTQYLLLYLVRQNWQSQERSSV